MCKVQLLKYNMFLRKEMMHPRKKITSAIIHPSVPPHNGHQRFECKWSCFQWTRIITMSSLTSTFRMSDLNLHKRSVIQIVNHANDSKLELALKIPKPCEIDFPAWGKWFILRWLKLPQLEEIKLIQWLLIYLQKVCWKTLFNLKQVSLNKLHIRGLSGQRVQQGKVDIDGYHTWLASEHF